MSMRTYKYRLYPTKTEVASFQHVLTLCRELYNAALQERRDAWNVAKRHPNYFDPAWRKEAAKDYSINKYAQSRQLTEIKHDLRPEYQEIGDHVLRNVLDRVDLAFQAFFRRVKQGGKAGYPRFQGKERYDSFTFPDRSGWKLQGTRLLLTKIGEIKIKMHRPLSGLPKMCTIKQEGEHWYVMIVCEVEAEKLPVSYEDVGIDLGVTHFAALSDSTFIDNPRHYRRAEKRLARLQQALSRKKRGSTRRKKAVRAIAKAHRKVRNQRKDFQHKAARQIVNRYQVIVFEDLKASNLSRVPKPKQDEATGQYLPNGASAKAGLNKSILDAGWASFMEMVRVKAGWAGRTTMFVNPKFTSQICSGCGTISKKDLSERWHSCECGCELDRDTNAAVNILRLGQKQLREGTAADPGS